jgi:hypothetical protein
MVAVAIMHAKVNKHHPTINLFEVKKDNHLKLEKPAIENNIKNK